MTERSTPRVTWAQPGDAAAVAERIAQEVRKPGARRMAFAGGSTPLKVLALLEDSDLDWSNVTVTLSDDRQVPDDHPASNFAKIQAVLGPKGAKLERLVEGAHVAPFDLVWIGMGTDGHYASIFPNMRATVRPGARVIATTPIPLPPEAPFDRLTLNRAALCATKALILVVTGEDKRALIEHALADGGAVAADWPISDILRVSDGPPVTVYWSA